MRKKNFPLLLTLLFLITQRGTAQDDIKPWSISSLSPQEMVDIFVKIIGSQDSTEVYLQYFGEIIAVLPGEKQIPLFKLKGLVRERWTPNKDESYTYENYDHGLFCDWETGKVLETYENPVTGKTNTPLHYNSGPLTETIGLGEGQSNPSDKKWIVNGDQIIISSNGIGKEFNNPVKPELYPLASTGKKVRYSTVSSYFAHIDDVGDKNIKSVNSSHNWLFVTNFPAWMKMGDRPGYVVWRWSANKFSDKTKIDPYIISEIEKRKPGFLTDDKPWPFRSDGWTQYSREIKPELKKEKTPDPETTATISGMAFVTQDLQGSISFYTDFLGFTVRKRIKINTPGGLANFGVTGNKELDYVALVPGEFSEENPIMGINFVEIKEAADTPFGQEGKRSPIAGEQMIAFAVQGLKGIENRMQEVNVPIVAPLTPSATGKSMTLAVLDPNGIRIQLYEYIKK